MTSATERFKNRTRPVVAARTDDLSAALQGSSDLETTHPPIVEQPSSSSSIRDVDTGLQKLKDELKALPKVGNFQLRVEEQYKAQIKQVADQNGITPETLIQGLWIVAQGQPDLIEEAVTEAKVHHQRRERAAELKIAITRATRALEKLRTLT